MTSTDYPSRYWMILFVIGIILFIISFILWLPVFSHDGVNNWVTSLFFIGGIIFTLIAIMWLLRTRTWNLDRSVSRRSKGVEFPEIM